MGTRLRHLNHSDLSVLEELIERLPDKVEIKSINYGPIASGAATQWICHFTLGDYQMLKSPVFKEPDLVKNINKKKKRGK